jgi:hypothetical protein
MRLASSGWNQESRSLAPKRRTGKYVGRAGGWSPGCSPDFVLAGIQIDGPGMYGDHTGPRVVKVWASETRHIR